MKQESTIHFLNEVHMLKRLPRIKKLHVLNVVPEDYNLRYFFTLIDWNQISKVVFRGCSEEWDNKVDVIKFYLQALDSVFRSQNVKLSSWYFSNSSIEALLNMCSSSIFKLTFDRCGFNIDSDLILIGHYSSMKFLQFIHWYNFDIDSTDVIYIQKIIEGIIKYFHKCRIEFVCIQNQLSYKISKNKAHTKIHEDHISSMEIKDFRLYPWQNNWAPDYYFTR